MCNPEGRLQKLMLGGAGLSCPAFPPSLSQFEALHTLELEIASFGGDTVANAAKVRGGAVRRGGWTDGRLLKKQGQPVAAGLHVSRMFSRLTTPTQNSPPPPPPRPQVLAPLPGLERIFLRNTDLKGPIPCSLVKDRPALMVLDVSDTPVSGELPGCVLAVGFLRLCLEFLEGL
jgi:hypothetical protein